MPLRVHALPCTSMCPPLAGMFNAHSRFVCTCLLMEAPQGLVLVDTGFGWPDMAEGRLPALTRAMLGIQRTSEDLAASHIRALGFDPRDVRDVICTHLDVDHAGGLCDFPEARVHVMRSEHDAAQRRGRYQPVQFAHGPRWQLHEPGRGEAWKGFGGVRDLVGLPPELLILPLPGHSSGHLAVAVQTAAGWLLHVGDAYYHAATLTEEAAPWANRLFSRIVDTDAALAQRQRIRLAALARGHEDVRVVCAHDPTDFDRAAAFVDEDATA